MIELFYNFTPNVFKVSILLEELAVPYQITTIDILAGAQFTPDFLAISPNNKIPAMVDHDPAGSASPITIFESGAMLIYLAEKHQRFLPSDAKDRASVMQWLMWQMGGLGPMLGQAHHFLHYSPEPVPYAIERYVHETSRLYTVLDRQLQSSEHVAGEYSIADIAIWPWIYFHDMHAQSLEEWPNIARWFDAIAKRPAVTRAMRDAPTPQPAEMTAKTRANLFGQKGR